jgi:hypothetical protein
MLLNGLIAISLLVIQGNQALTTTVPDLSGTWRLEKNLSTIKGLPDMDDYKSVDELTFVISQTPSMLVVKRIIKERKHKERVSELTYYTDGRGEKGSFLFSNDKWKSKTNWVDGALVSKFTVTDRFMSEFYYSDYKETWSLSKDGEVLTVTTEIAVRNVPSLLKNRVTSRTRRKVFQRIH